MYKWNINFHATIIKKLCKSKKSLVKSWSGHHKKIICLQRVFKHDHVIWQDFQDKLSHICKEVCSMNEWRIFQGTILDLDLKSKVSVNYVAYVFAIRECFFRMGTCIAKLYISTRAYVVTKKTSLKVSKFQNLWSHRFSQNMNQKL